MTKAALFAVFFLPAAALFAASTPPGAYDLYDGSGKKTGTVTSTISTGTYAGAPTRRIQVKTDIASSGVFSKYAFTEVDWAEFDSKRLIFFRQETVENNKKSVTSAEVADGNIRIKVDREGKKYVVALATSVYQITEFELGLPESPIWTLKPGQTKTYNVFDLDTLNVLPITLNRAEAKTLPYNGKKARVIVVTSTMRGKSTTLWYDEKTRELLQEEGPNHLMSRSTE